MRLVSLLVICLLIAAAPPKKTPGKSSVASAAILGDSFKAVGDTIEIKANISIRDKRPGTKYVLSAITYDKTDRTLSVPLGEKIYPRVFSPTANLSTVVHVDTYRPGVPPGKYVFTLNLFEIGAKGTRSLVARAGGDWKVD